MTERSIYHTIPHWNVLRGGMFNIIEDAWWLVDEDDNPLFSSRYNSPMCNDNKSIAERFSNEHRVKQIPFVYVPVRIQDYR